MGLFVLIGLAIFLILIVLSVCAYPFICAWIAIASKKYKGIVTGILLLLTVAAYMFASTTLEYPLDNWCYSVYAGIVLTPAVLFCIGVEEHKNWPKNGEIVKRHNTTIPLLTIIASSLFAIEGVMRMIHSYSIHKLLNSGWSNTTGDSFWLYSEDFQYAGVLLFSISIISVLFIGISFFNSNKEYKRNLSDEEEKNNLIKEKITKITQRLNAEIELLSSFDSKQAYKILHYHKSFCRTIISALESSDERNDMKVEFKSFNNINTSYKVLFLSNSRRRYYVYPMGIVVCNSNDTYKYLSIDDYTVSYKRKQIERDVPIPGIVQPIRLSWLHSCVDGSCDLRYSYNPCTYIYEYDILTIAGLILNVFSLDKAKDVVNTYSELYSLVSQARKRKNRPSKRTVSSKDQSSTTQEISENQELSLKLERKEIEEQQQYTIDNPRTLEECFCHIIQRRGTDVLKDKNLTYLLSSTYKEVDITEYKDVMEKMVSECFLCQFIEVDKQNDFTLYNLSNVFARKNKINVQKSLFITQALVNAIKKSIHR